MFIDDPYYANQKIKWWIYFTNWGLILLNTRLLMGAFFLDEVSTCSMNAELTTVLYKCFSVYGALAHACCAYGCLVFMSRMSISKAT